MNNNKRSSISLLKILGCFVFDIALILAFFQIFGLFLIISPVKSILMIFVLLFGLMIFNGVVLFSNMLFKSIGIPYSAASITLAILYVLISNVLSIFLILGSSAWYIIWQLIIFASFILIFAVIAAFSNGAAKDILKDQNEQVDKAFIMSQLLEIEDAFAAKEDQESIMHSLDLFIALKERIQFSTPFGRITSNIAVSKAEGQITNNLVSLRVLVQENLNDKNLDKLQKLLADTRRLVINREILNIK